MTVYRINTVRARLKSSTVAGATVLDAQMQVLTSYASHCIVFPESTAPVEVMQGQIWCVAGPESTRKFVRDGFTVQEIRIHARKAELLRPSGEHIVQLMARSPDFAGVGEVTARKLWEAYGQDLYVYLDEGDRDALAAVIGERLVDSVLAGWSIFDASDTIQWLHSAGIDLRVSRRLLDIHGDKVRTKLAEDPYRVLALGMSWKGADELAKKHFGVRPDDPRRLVAAVEAELFDALDSGNTAAYRTDIEARLTHRLGKYQVTSAVQLALEREVVLEEAGVLTGLGTAVIERSIADALASRMKLEPLCDEAFVDAVIEEYEAQQSHEIGQAFRLNDAQKRAIRAVAKYGVLLITGGAGVGKTAVLRAVCHLLSAVACPVQTLALSGRAAKRIAEATGRKSSTIAGYLRNIVDKRLPEQMALVIDEASMLDVLLAHQVLSSLPPRARVILLGDPGQLPPVGPGMTLHALVDSSLPQVQLTEIKRFSGLIAETAKALREGVWPALEENPRRAASCAAVPTESVIQAVLDLYMTDPDNTQILTFNRRGAVSCQTINQGVQRALVGKRFSRSANERPPLKIVNEDGDLEYTGLRLLDKVICTKNLWNEGVQNGSLGRIVKLHAPPVLRSKLESVGEGETDELVHAEVVWDDGVCRPVTTSVLDAMELAYAITTHKSQGSQFRRVLVVVSTSRLLDRTMLYTAVTRAMEQVILVGDMGAAKAAAEAPPHASRRVVTLQSRVATSLVDHASGSLC